MDWNERLTSQKFHFPSWLNYKLSTISLRTVLFLSTSSACLMLTGEPSNSSGPLFKITFPSTQPSLNMPYSSSFFWLSTFQIYFLLSAHFLTLINQASIVIVRLPPPSQSDFKRSVSISITPLLAIPPPKNALLLYSVNTILIPAFSFFHLCFLLLSP